MTAEEAFEEYMNRMMNTTIDVTIRGGTIGIAYNCILQVVRQFGESMDDDMAKAYISAFEEIAELAGELDDMVISTFTDEEKVLIDTASPA